MSARFRAVALLDLRHARQRPLYWIWALLVFLTVWGLAAGNVRIQSGDAAVGGTKAFVTSELAQAQLMALLVPLVYTFFVAVAAGMSVLSDEELGVGELLHSTPLRAREYVWGKFAAVLGCTLAVLGLQIAATIFFHYAGDKAELEELVGPFALASYVRPALVFALPLLVFLAGTSFAIGERTRRPIVVFVLPIAFVLGSVFFLWEWTPSWLDPRIDRLLMLIDPSGFRWLSRTWLEDDRGVEVYNTAPLALDAGFAASRVAFALLGLAGVLYSAERCAKSLRQGGARGSRARAAATESSDVDAAALGAGRRPGTLATTAAVARVELRELASQPGLYLFVPLIVLQTLANGLAEVGAFDTPLIPTAGTLATRTAPWLVVLGCLLTLFYLVESLGRDARTRLAPIVRSTPVQSSALVAGALLANAALLVLVIGVTLASALVVLLVEQSPLELLPFALVYGLAVAPTLALWCAFVAAVYALLASRYSTYAVGLAALVGTGWAKTHDHLSWAIDWALFGAVRWSDLGLFPLDLEPLLWNRLAALVLAAALFFVAARLLARRELDRLSLAGALRPAALRRAARALQPAPALLLVALLVCAWLARKVDAGFHGARAERAAKDYWRRNAATWLDAPTPDLVAVELDVELEPAARRFRTSGRYLLANRTGAPLARIALTGGAHWEAPTWTLAGETCEPDDRKRLFVFEPTPPLAPGAELELGFRLAGAFPSGFTKDGGGAQEFILQAGVVLTSFTPSFAPVLGFVEGIGVDEENEWDAREHEPGFYAGTTPSAFGSGAPFTLSCRVTIPEEYTANGVGTLVEESVADGRRTSLWKSDAPVRFYNIVAGRFDVWRGAGTAIFHHPAHARNVAEMGAALDAARRLYSQWFQAYPYGELKLSEFPALAGYAQGFPSNITFSEGIGFLAKQDPRVNAPFLVTAHEAAHQWWGNLLTPGRGPGADVLSEGLAHFSTILLFDAVKGARERIEFCARIEERYGERRQRDSERPLVWLDGSRPGDESATYDKGGFVFWMLASEIGRERVLAGLRTFIERFRASRDHPVLFDLVAHLRDFAPDRAAYDEFAAQWFEAVVLPEYRLSDASSRELADAEPEARYETRVRVRNAGSGRAPLEVAASRGVRFPAPGDAPDDFVERRVVVTLGAGEEQEVVLRTPFEPERITLDPDALVLQLGRDAARIELP